MLGATAEEQPAALPAHLCSSLHWCLAFRCSPCQPMSPLLQAGEQHLLPSLHHPQQLCWRISCGLTSAVLPLLQGDDENLLPSPRSSQAVLPAHMGPPRALPSAQGSEPEERADSETAESSATDAEYNADSVENASLRPVSRPDIRLPSQGGLVSLFAACCFKLLLLVGCQMVSLYEWCTRGSVCTQAAIHQPTCLTSALLTPGLAVTKCFDRDSTAPANQPAACCLLSGQGFSRCHSICKLPCSLLHQPIAALADDVEIGCSKLPAGQVDNMPSCLPAHLALLPCR